jgi:hypothetical protein
MRLPESALYPALIRHEHACSGRSMHETGRTHAPYCVVVETRRGDTDKMTQRDEIALLNGRILVRRRAYEECSLIVLQVIELFKVIKVSDLGND